MDSTGPFAGPLLTSPPSDVSPGQHPLDTRGMPPASPGREDAALVQSFRQLPGAGNPAGLEVLDRPRIPLPPSLVLEARQTKGFVHPWFIQPTNGPTTQLPEPGSTRTGAGGAVPSILLTEG
jgi:hypothetical protein